MIYDKALAVASLRPYKAWSWAGEDYSGFTWQDSGTAPTEDEINAELTRLTNEEPMRLIRVERDKKLTNSDWVVTKATEEGETADGGEVRGGKRREEKGAGRKKEQGRRGRRGER